MKKDYVIWVSYHKDELVPLHGLKEDEHHRLFATHKDADGENINIMNPSYSEMVTMWYVWKNNLKSEYVGFEHYRRHLDVNRLPGKGECQVYKFMDFGDFTVYEQYSQYHNRHDLDVMLDILEEKYGKDNGYVKHIKEGHILISNCTFLMRWTDFTRLCRFMFPLLEEFGSRFGIEGYDEKALAKWHKKAYDDFGGYKTEYQARLVSFVAERLISAWIDKNLNPFNGVDVVTVHYNTPELTSAAIKSLNKVSPGCRVFLLDNSDRKPFREKIQNVTVIDNTKGQIIDFEKELEKYPDRNIEDAEKFSNFGTAKHLMSVEYMTEYLPDGFILIDSDILLMKDIRCLVERDFVCTAVESSKKNVNYFVPFLCWLNVPMMKENGIHYFNGEKTWALTKKEPDCWYDTGAWFHEEVVTKGLPWKFENIWSFLIHYGHGSWRDKPDKMNEWLTKYKFLYE